MRCAGAARSRAGTSGARRSGCRSTSCSAGPFATGSWPTPTGGTRSSARRRSSTPRRGSWWTGVTARSSSIPSAPGCSSCPRTRRRGRFSAATAIRIAGLLEPYRPGWIEEPVPPENLKALAKVAEHTDIPIATGERLHTRFDYRELFELQAADIIQTDITHSGGLLEAKKLAGTAETHYLLMAPHNVGGP